MVPPGPGSRGTPTVRVGSEDRDPGPVMVTLPRQLRTRTAEGVVPPERKTSKTESGKDRERTEGRPPSPLCVLKPLRVLRSSTPERSPTESSHPTVPLRCPGRGPRRPKVLPRDGTETKVRKGVNGL